MRDLFQQYSEYDPLDEVIIGRSSDYALHSKYVEIVNESQKSGLPTVDELKKDFLKFSMLLEQKGISVFLPDYAGKFVYDQLTPRDIGVVIGRKFFICPMLKASRKYEVSGIFRYLEKKQAHEPNVIIPSGNDVVFEGGDIIIDHPYVYVGISQRTNQAGYDFLKDQLSSEFELIKVQCKPLESGEDILHLDCTFNPLGNQTALIYPEGIERIPKSISDRYDLVVVNRSEQEALATNVLSLNDSSIISRDHPDCQGINESLREKGFEVIETPFNAAPSTGGSFRCCTLPLYRKRNDLPTN